MSIRYDLQRQIDLDFAQTQRELARARADAPWKPKPVGACDQCGAWREDGAPPTVHFTGCFNGELPNVKMRPNVQSMRAGRMKRGA